MGLGFYFISKSYLMYESLCVGFGLIQLGFGLLFKVGVLVLLCCTDMAFLVHTGAGKTRPKSVSGSVSFCLFFFSFFLLKF